MAIVKDLKVGQKVTYRGRSGELMEVDQPSGLVKFRYDVPREQAVSSDGVRQPVPADVSVHADEVSAVPVVSDVTTRGPVVAVPTTRQIEAARKAAAEKVKGEHLSASKLEDVQDEAEAELVARMARGEPA